LRVRTNWVPSAFTLANLFCGYFSTILSANGKFIQAAWLIVAAAVLDALDGKIARFAKADSRFGVEYDSLADVISFGFAPSFLIYKSLFSNWGTIGLLISSGPLVFGSIRLARFNIRLKGLNKDYFEGLPIPATAVTLATFYVFNDYFWDYVRWEKVYLFMSIALSILMVTSVRYETMPSFSLQSGLQNRAKFLIFLIGTLLVILFPQETFFPLSAGYVLSGPTRFTWMILRGNGSKNNGNKKETGQ
jgi:CDP-diacylglycerol--serine O-phosphatidyltransferase